VVAIALSFPNLPAFAPVSQQSSSTKDDGVAHLTDTRCSPNDDLEMGRRARIHAEMG
jgi:hypothetical protein